VAAQVAQVPLLQLGVAPPHTPQLSVPPQPSGAVPHVRPSSAQVLGTQTHCPFWHCSCPVQIPQLWPGRPQFWLVFPGSQVPGFPTPLEEQPVAQLCAVHKHWVPSGLHVVFGGQRFSQSPPHPSGPQTLPSQFRAQQVPWARLQTQSRTFGQSASWAH
jgi:hypothetical protein